jgi:hypothetical protein
VSADNYKENDMRHANVLFYDDDVECDMCDGRNKVMAHIECLGGDVMVICTECLNKIVINSPTKAELDSISKS